MVDLEFLGFWGFLGIWWILGSWPLFWVPGHFSGFLARSWVSGGGGQNRTLLARGGPSSGFFWPPDPRIRDSARIDKSGSWGVRGPGIRVLGGPGIRVLGGPGVLGSGSWGVLGPRSWGVLGPRDPGSWGSWGVRGWQKRHRSGGGGFCCIWSPPE